MQIAHHDPFLVLSWKRISIRVSDAAVRRLLMAVIGNRTNSDGERRISSSLPFVITSLDKMKQMIVRPMAGLDDRAAFIVLGDAVRIAGSFANNLKFQILP